jgi:hypothetical protein
VSFKLSRLAPGLLVATLNIIAPYAAYRALFLSPDKRIESFFRDPVAAGIIDAHTQTGIVFVSSIVLLITAIIHFFRPDSSRGSRKVALAIVIATGCLFLWIFVLGGAALLPLDPYMRISEPGDIHFPPMNSWLTWVRYVQIALAAILSFLELKGGAEEMNDAA